jgi:cellulose synthase/poly-beta-1,6-N-acetylglucosamine synthase-like glycosyltransferase
MSTGNEPFVTVVVPVRNGERTIGDNLASVIRSDYPRDRYEVLVVDNASTDRTAAIVRRYPVRYVREARRGPSAARNRGIEESRGEVVAFIDADCIATTRWLRELVSGFSEHDVLAVAGEILAYPPATRAERYDAMRKERWQAYALARDRPFPVTANVAFRSETFDRIGRFDQRLRAGEDQDFGWRFFDAGLKLVYHDRALVFHRHRSTSWDLFTQNVTWGYGAAQLHRKHGLPWSLRQELHKYGELFAAFGSLGRSALRHGQRREDDMELYYPYFEVVRRLGLRVGALYGLLRELPSAADGR